MLWLKIFFAISLAQAAVLRPCVRFLETPPAGVKETPIVLGILYNSSGQVLVGQRQPPQDWIGLWEFPGGKVEAGETPEQALQREFKEEVGLTIKVKGLLDERHQEFDSKLLHIRFYVVVETEVDLQPKPRAHSKLTWVGPDTIGKIPFMVPDEPVFAKVWPLK